MSTPSVEALVERLERLEATCDRLHRRARRWMIAGIGAILATSLLIAAGARPAGVPKVIEAESFVVRDEHGAEVGRLGGGARLVLLGPDAGPGVDLRADKDGGSLSVHRGTVHAGGLALENRKGQLYAGLGDVDEGGRPMLALYGPRQVGQAILSLADGGANLLFRDKEGDPRIGLGLMPDGRARLAFLRGKRDFIVMELGANGAPGLWVAGKKGEADFQVPRS